MSAPPPPPPPPLDSHVLALFNVVCAPGGSPGVVQLVDTAMEIPIDNSQRLSFHTFELERVGGSSGPVSASVASYDCIALLSPDDFADPRCAVIRNGISVHHPSVGHIAIPSEDYISFREVVNGTHAGLRSVWFLFASHMCGVGVL